MTCNLAHCQKAGVLVQRMAGGFSYLRKHDFSPATYIEIRYHCTALLHPTPKTYTGRIADNAIIVWPRRHVSVHHISPAPMLTTSANAQPAPQGQHRKASTTTPRRAKPLNTMAVQRAHPCQPKRGTPPAYPSASVLPMVSRPPSVSGINTTGDRPQPSGKPPAPLVHACKRAAYSHVRKLPHLQQSGHAPAI